MSETLATKEVETIEKENYITWINICVGLSDNEEKQLRKMDLRGVRVKYRLVLQEKTNEMLKRKQGQR
ncbi:hypothetical protein K4P50_11260 [Staphylococcus epidermidis]|uniref:hypothetical protein n=1 Tax=Staphylococcus TaxID=1279 RepID=UPI000F542F07|nr:MULTISPECIES: hypothetical protein [Staphylococcus]MCD9074482.1 hypothetical protein [Staphylococcus epidermidis]MCG1072147.1 hypothetical protein [Staphylococcus epidermidis]RQN00768.1 hypothetical protein CPA43_01005 [Staphylococcus warneri]